MEAAVLAEPCHPKLLARWLIAGGLFVGCTTTPRSTPVATLTAAVAAPVAAWACAEVLRAEAPGADPLPWHAGALAIVRDDTFSLVQHRDRDGRWRTAANSRLVPLPDSQSALTIRLQSISATEAVPVREGQRRFEVRPTTARTCAIELHSDGAETARLLGHLTALLATLEAWSGHQPMPQATGCCVRHSEWTARAWLRTAHRQRAAGDLDAALAAARTAAALAPGLADAWQPVSALAHTVTADPTSSHGALAAMLLANDPVARARCTRSFAVEQQRVRAPDPADMLRAEAIALQRQGDTAAARRVRANAMALQPDTVADLRLRWDDATRQADHHRALESLLLLREYAADDGSRDLLLGYEAALPALARRRAPTPADSLSAPAR
ncbi:MAG: hypothetical protein IPK26_24835 [Planctomycetes bacterium]|nr:hypothetical protein [Planctomycetota bacterium]